MKKKTLLRALAMILAFHTMNNLVKAQDCITGEVYSCFYISENLIATCLCVDSTTTFAQQCPDGEILACRYHKCNYECKCLSAADAVKWISRGAPCHQNGGGGGGGGWHGNPHHWWFRSVDEDNSLDDVSFFSGVNPNPVYNSTTIGFYLSKPQNISIKIFDLNGRLVSTLVDQVLDEGNNEIVWSAEEENAGIYFLQFQSAQILNTQTLVVTK